jgi:hypothetical protein
VGFGIGALFTTTSQGTVKDLFQFKGEIYDIGESANQGFSISVNTGSGLVEMMRFDKGGIRFNDGFSVFFDNASFPFACTSGNVVEGLNASYLQGYSPFDFLLSDSALMTGVLGGLVSSLVNNAPVEIINIQVATNDPSGPNEGFGSRCTSTIFLGGAPKVMGYQDIIYSNISNYENDYVLSLHDGVTTINEKFRVKSNGSLVLTANTDSDLAVTFAGTSNSGLLTWMEDEDYFKFADDINLGGETDFVKISDTDGNMTWGGTFKKKLAIRPALFAGKTTTPQKPTPIFYNAFATYSMPIYNSDNEELFWRLSVPGRWDGTTDIEYVLYVALDTAETLNDDFKMQLSWSNTNGTTGVVSSSTVDVPVSGKCTTNHDAQYSVFKLTFTIDVSAGPGGALASGDVLAGRVRRIASNGTEIAGELLVLDHTLNFTVDRVFKVS